MYNVFMSHRYKMNKKDTSTSTKKSILEKFLIFGTLLIFAVLPLLYFPWQAVPHLTSKNFFFMGMVDILLCLWIWLAFTDTRYRLAKKNLLILAPLFLFLVSLTISGIFGIDPLTSFFSFIESGTGMFFLWHAFFFAMIIASLIRVHKEVFLKKILQANLFASVVLAIATFFADPRLFTSSSAMLSGSAGGAMSGNSSLAGAYFVFSIFFSLVLAFIEQSKKLKVWYWSGIVLIGACPIYLNADLWKGNISLHQLFHNPTILIGQARMAVISVIIGLVLSVCLAIGLETKKKLLKVSGFVGFFGIVLMVSLGMWQVVTPNTSLHTLFVDWGQGSVTNRLSYWHEAVKGIQERPLLGWGPENYRAVNQKYLDPIVFSPGHGDEVWTFHPHNSFLEILINGGIIAFLLYIFLLITLVISIVSLYKRKKISGKTTAFFISMLFAYLLQDQLVYDSVISYVAFFSFIGIIAGLYEENQTEQISLEQITILTYILGILVTLTLFFICISVAWLPSREVTILQYVGEYSNNERTVAYDHLFHSTASYTVDNDIGFYLLSLSNTFDAERTSFKSNSAYVTVASQDVDFLVGEINSIWSSDRYDGRTPLALVRFENLLFYLNGTVSPERLQLAQTYFARGVALSPTDPQIYLAYAETLADTHDIAGARAMIDKAVALNPDYLDAVNTKINFDKAFGSDK